MKEGEAEVPEIGEWFGIEPFGSIVGHFIVVRENYGIKRIKYPKRWTQPRLYTNRFASSFEEALLNFEAVKLIV